MEARPDSVSFPLTLALQQTTLDTPIVGLLSAEEPPTGEMAGLDFTEIREEDAEILDAVAFYCHTVQRRFIRVEGDE